MENNLFKKNDTKEQIGIEQNQSPQIVIKKGKAKYEDYSKIIDIELEKRRNGWRVEVPGISFEDIKQEIRIHIYNKWHKWEQSRPFANWVNTLISNQLKNKVRDNLLNYVRPCIGCKANEGGDKCRLNESGLQDSTCSLYLKWEQNKKHSLGLHLPEALEKHDYQAGYIDNDIDAYEFLKRVAPIIKRDCCPQTYKIFNLLYVKNIPEKKAAKLMGYKSTEKNRAAGYKQLLNHQETIKKIIKDLLKNEEARFV